MADPRPDVGLDSQADLRIFSRLLLWGLAAAVIVAFVALVVTGNWALVGAMLVCYLVIAATQYYAAYRRARERGAVGEF
ncbi:MAG: hypothetical protein OEW42_00690 [Acidimicrobiia bacterium]|nr:hypothetical protein [Acidimicrobiia bacterium]MDH5238142.1 hypothetical protein [Acidimicrobiia bacterium]